MNTSFGETLRAAREAKGLTTSQIASKTRMLVQIVEEMENEDFHRIAAPIYGRGFVKLYAECVDLDPLPLVKEFMDIYEGRRAPIVRTRDVPVQAPTPPPPPEPPSPEPASEPIPEPPSPEPAPTPISEPPSPEPAPTPIPEPPSPEPALTPIPEPPPVIVFPPQPAPVPPPEAEPAPAPIPEPPPVVVISPPPASVPTPEPPPEPEPAPEPIPEPPPVVRGLELFEAAVPRQPRATEESSQAPLPAQSSSSNVADIFADSPYLSTESSYGGEGPSAADRFRKSLSSVSHGVIQSVRDIPRSVWRIALLAIASLALLALLAWGCIKLYQATSITPVQRPLPAQDIKETKEVKDLKPAKLPQPDPKPAVQPAPKPAAKSAPKPTGKPADAKPAKRPPLRSTGQKIPTLYAD